MVKPSILTPPVMDKNGSEEKQLYCHRMYIPSTIAIPVQDPISKQQKLQVEQKIAYTVCIKERCMRWNAKKETCWDNADSEHWEILANYAEIPSGTGGGQ